LSGKDRAEQSVRDVLMRKTTMAEEQAALTVVALTVPGASSWVPDEAKDAILAAKKEAKQNGKPLDLSELEKQARRYK
jgi:hypothetical protein